MGVLEKYILSQQRIKELSQQNLGLDPFVLEFEEFRDDLNALKNCPNMVVAWVRESWLHVGEQIIAKQTTRFLVKYTDFNWEATRTQRQNSLGDTQDCA